jgi:hypothetical protein
MFAEAALHSRGLVVCKDADVVEGFSNGEENPRV